MRIETLASPGNLSNCIRLRTEAAKAISQMEVVCARTPGGKTTSAKVLSDFFADCVSKLAGLIDSIVPTISGAVAASATTIKVSFSEAMDTTVVPPLSAFAIAGDTFTGAAWGPAGDAGKLILTGTGFAAAESLGYTAPAVSYLRDKAGLKVASGSVTLS